MTTQQNPAPSPSHLISPTGTGPLPAAMPPLPLEKDMVVRWLIEELPHASCTDPSKTRMPVDMSVVTNLFGQDLDIMFQNGAPDQVRFARCWKSMSKRLETTGQDPLPIMTSDSIKTWAAANPPPAPPPVTNPDRVDLDAILSQPPPPDPNAPPIDPANLAPPLLIPPAPPIPGDGQVSSPPAGFTPNGTPAAPQNQPDPPADPLNDPYVAPTPQPPKKPRFNKKSFLKVLAVVAAAAAIIAVVVVVIKNWSTLSSTVASWTKPRPAPPVAAAPTQTAAPVQTSAPAVPTAPAQVISARCDFQIDGLGLSSCSWISGPGPFQCDLGTSDGRAAAKCGEFNYMGSELPQMPARGIVISLKR